MALFERLHTRYGSAAAFKTIYIEEIHASDETFKMADRHQEGGRWQVAQPKSLLERQKVGLELMATVEPRSQYLLDSMSNAALLAFSALPERLYILEGGAVAYAGGCGPMGYLMYDMEAWLAKRFPSL